MGGKPAYINYISPGQLNVLAPDISAGPVSVTVITYTVPKEADIDLVPQNLPALAWNRPPGADDRRIHVGNESKYFSDRGVFLRKYAQEENRPITYLALHTSVTNFILKAARPCSR